jgi:hypothetical protein
VKAYSAFLQAFRRITEFSCFDGKEDTGAATGSNCKNWRSMEPKALFITSTIGPQNHLC